MLNMIILKQLKKTIKCKKGFTIIEFLCSLAIIGILATMAIPQVASWNEHAKNSVTVGSSRATVGTIQGCMALYESENWYAPRASWNSSEYSDNSMNNYLEMLFENGSVPNESYSYENQVSGSRVVLNWSNPIGGTAEDPAIFLTNNASYSYANSTPASMALLKGTIVLYFATTDISGNLDTSHIEVYYTDENGNKCDDKIILTM